MPTDALEKEEFVTGLVRWIFANSCVDGLFYLLLDNEAVPQANKVAKFDHHDDTCCWFLNLSESEFGFLRDVWKKSNLPADLFYPVQKAICIPYPGNSLKAKVLRLFGVQRCYTPMQWQTKENGGEVGANLRFP